VLFAALIRRNATFLLLFEDSLKLYAPDFISDELALHKDELLEKTSQTSSEFDQAYLALSKRLHMVPTSRFAGHVPDAQALSPDPKDVSYFALALYLGGDVALWSNDKRLKSQDRIAIVSTSELIELLYHSDPYVCTGRLP
jgi:predicted nucleic acid-binding protein